MIEFFDNKYEVIIGKENFNKETVENLLTDYFEPYKKLLCLWLPIFSVKKDKMIC